MSARVRRSDPGDGARSPGWLGPAALLVLLAGAWGAWWHVRPPAPEPLSAPETRFSAERAMTHVRRIADEPHMVGTEAHARVRQYLVGELRDLGFDVEIHLTTALRRRDEIVRAATVRSIVARRPGADPTGALALTSHYDSQPHAPGAGDDASGVAAVLEGVRAVLAGAEPLRNDLVVLITDGEELGLMGARVFVDEHPLADDIDVLFNFEGRGAGGPSVAFETTPENGWVVRELAAADPHPAGSSVFYEIYRRLPNDTDFSHFKELDLAGVNFAIADDADVYHRTTDTPGNLSRAGLQHHGEHVTSLTRHFGALELGRTGEADVVFFTVPGIGMVHYAVTWVMPLFVVVAALFLVVLVWGIARGELGIGAALGGVVIAVAGSGLGAAAGRFLWENVSARHPEYGSLVGRVLYTEGWYVVALAAFVLVVMSGLYGLARTFLKAPGLVWGALLPAVTAAGLAALYMPGAAMVFTWPALAGLVAVVWLMQRSSPEPSEPDRRGSLDLLVLGALAAPALVLQVPLLWAVFIGLNLSNAHVLGTMFALLLALLLPLVELTRSPNGWWLPALALVAGAAFVGAGAARAGSFDARHPAPSSLFHVVDLRSGDALWGTMQEVEEDDVWLRRFVPADADPGELGDLSPRLVSPVRVAPAPTLEAEPPEIEVLEDTVADGTRFLTLAVRPWPEAQIVELWPAGGSPGAGEVRLVTVNGKPPPARPADDPVVEPGGEAGDPDEGTGEQDPGAGEEGRAGAEEEGRAGAGEEGRAGAATRETGVGPGLEPPWFLEHIGVPDGAVLVRLEAPPGIPVELGVLQQRIGLPDLPDGPDVTRPADLAPNVLTLTDRTLVRSAFTVPARPAGEHGGESGMENRDVPRRSVPSTTSGLAGSWREPRPGAQDDDRLQRRGRFRREGGKKCGGDGTISGAGAVPVTLRIDCPRPAGPTARGRNP